MNAPLGQRRRVGATAPCGGGQCAHRLHSRSTLGAHPPFVCACSASWPGVVRSQPPIDWPEIYRFSTQQSPKSAEDHAVSCPTPLGKERVVSNRAT